MLSCTSKGQLSLRRVLQKKCWQEERSDQTEDVFKQVPPKIVREIMEQQTEQEKVAVLPATTRNRKLRVNLVEGLGVIRYE